MARAAAWSRVGLAVAVVLVLGTAACAGGRSPTGPDGAEGDQRYGPAPVPHPEVTYQPDVVIVGGGSGSVRAVSPDALTWFIDPRAERADDLRPGEIMFLTGRAVGRILDVRRDGEHLAVTLGPVDITEVIRDGTFTAEQPVPLDAPQRHDAGAPFWAEYDADPAGPPETFGPGPVTAGAAVRVGDLAPGSFHVAAAPAAVPAPPRRQAGGFSVTPTCCTGGVGARFTYDSGGIRLAGQVTLLMEKPSGRFHLEIRGGTVQRAEMRIHGMAGLRVEIAGATTVKENISRHIPIPVDFSVPIGQILGVPFSATVNQIVGVQTAFSSEDGNIKAAGEWSLSGSLGFGYVNGSFQGPSLAEFTTRNSILDSVTGVSVGVTGIIVSYQAAFRIGLGAFGFTAGLYLKMTVTVGLTVGSALGAPLTLCRGAQLGIWADYGVGYRIPSGLVKAINAFLELINVSPIDREGGIGTVENLFNRSVVQPDVPLCR